MTQQEYEQLIKELNNATIQYDAAAPTMTDSEWDRKYFLVQDYEKTHTPASNSPTHSIIFSARSKLHKVQHSHAMLSLAKTKSLRDLRIYYDTFCRKDRIHLVAMQKMDGLSCSLTYKKGKLIAAETRGDGEIGEDVLHNALTIANIPKRLSKEIDLVVDGEVICNIDVFEQHFAQDYQNPRNFAAGSIRLLDPKECANRRLRFVAWDVIEMENCDTDNFVTQLSFLRLLGFDCVATYLIDNDANIEQSFKDAIDAIKVASKDAHEPIDGVVFKMNNKAAGRRLGRTAHHFKDAIAFKFEDGLYTTTIKEVIWQEGRSGKMTPVAILEPVTIEGTIVERASLHNLSIYMDTVPLPGDTVFVIKANLIIPQIAENRTHTLKGLDDKIKRREKAIERIPKICPNCGTELIEEKSDTSLSLVCPSATCGGKLLNSLIHFCSKQGLDIQGLSEATLQFLIDEGWVTSRASIFNLSTYANKWKKQKGFGEASVNKIFNSIEAAKQNITLDNFLAALGIPLIGGRAAIDLAQHYESYREFREAIDSHSLKTIKGFGPERISNLYSYDYSDADAIVDMIGDIKSIALVSSDKSLQNQTFVITGKLQNFKNRKECVQYIESKGGKVVNNITSQTSYLINNDISSTTVKNKEAKKLGVPIITEQDLLSRS